MSPWVTRALLLWAAMIAAYFIGRGAGYAEHCRSAIAAPTPLVSCPLCKLPVTPSPPSR